MHMVTHQAAPPSPMNEMHNVNPTITPPPSPVPLPHPSIPPPASQSYTCDAPVFAPCIIVGPMWLEPWLVEYSRVEPLEYVFIDGAELTKTHNHLAAEFFHRQLGISKITAQIVIHSFPTYAIVMEHQQGWKLVYSGDTRPCQPLIEVPKSSFVCFDNSKSCKNILSFHESWGRTLPC